MDAAIRLKGPLHLLAGLGVAAGSVLEDPAGEPDAAGRRPLIFLPELGLGLRFALPVRPELGLAFQLAPNPARSDGLAGEGLPAVPGLVGLGGVAIPLGKAPMSLRLQVGGGFLGGWPFFRAGGGIAIGG